MLTGPQEVAIHILKSFAKEAGLLENNPSWEPQDLRTQVEADGDYWDLFLQRIGTRDLNTLNQARRYLGLPPWNKDDVTMNL
jgi:hypothetical protein